MVRLHRVSFISRFMGFFRMEEGFFFVNYSEKDYFTKLNLNWFLNISTIFYKTNAVCVWEGSNFVFINQSFFNNISLAKSKADFFPF